MIFFLDALLMENSNTMKESALAIKPDIIGQASYNMLKKNYPIRRNIT